VALLEFRVTEFAVFFLADDGRFGHAGQLVTCDKHIAACRMWSFSTSVRGAESDPGQCVAARGRGVCINFLSSHSCGMNTATSPPTRAASAITR
jgi:hypothetical protein